MDFLLLYHFRKLKGVAIEILQVLIDDITTNMIFEILAIKFLSEIEKYLAMATLVPSLYHFIVELYQRKPLIGAVWCRDSYRNPQLSET